MILSPNVNVKKGPFCVTFVTSTSGQTESSSSFESGKSWEHASSTKCQCLERSFFMTHRVTSMTCTSGQTGSSTYFKVVKARNMIH